MIASDIARRRPTLWPHPAPRKDTAEIMLARKAASHNRLNGAQPHSFVKLSYCDAVVRESR
ncbi:hypothetical protein HYPGJ_31912 [Hyphomicrobium sp. GJ21]|nr:hypothetical protein HYPGJ_31912 [Hyphomicrobium sp. GJ21]